MSVAMKLSMTRDEFLAWAEAQDVRHEFDGERPVAMTGGSVDHNQITLNLHVALRGRLRSGCRALGPDVGVPIGEAVRYPDALVTCAPLEGRDRLVAEPVVVFEVVSPGSSRVDRIEKVRAYHAVASIRRYVLVEQDSRAVTVHWRVGDEPWRVEVLTEGELALPEVDAVIPVGELYEGIAFESDQRSTPRL